ncbi:MAG: endonuclease [gamma proteobacterium symbiont of Ctena orbiculata]|nr:endonuclease [Candidatus Thiodiazotropha taylori]MBT3058504.1 endonuclease [Candidatus Thiodiazotropha sp. (ex Lucina pensylvanica)]MBV2096918.1 endonuclease [Candidatus Thiodiazotropha sp. (ex Codakia orbicularis)]PUB75583.1 MAG: endonuclease [gamma proteobacterium symbiont of Ctena orbiculata]MBT3063419.1 endonuclease [Candidatus Thiodiazotropha sp. (ex Lucina pensylvanica)]
MNGSLKCVDGLYYPEFHAGWGGCAEELFHYTSRYFTCTEAFLRNLADQRQFNMSGYQANRLSKEQRHLMAAILACEPNIQSARAITQIVRAVINGESKISETLAENYREHLKVIPDDVELVYSDRTHHHHQPDVAPLDPFLNLASRLNLPVAVHTHHLEVPLKALAQHLDSPNPSLRNSLQDAILNLHSAGYALKNHPGLTHKTARELGDKDSR